MHGWILEMHPSLLFFNFYRLTSSSELQRSPAVPCMMKPFGRWCLLRESITVLQQIKGFTSEFASMISFRKGSDVTNPPRLFQVGRDQLLNIPASFFAIGGRHIRIALTHLAGLQGGKLDGGHSLWLPCPIPPPITYIH